MASENGNGVSPSPYFDKATGYFYLKKGGERRKIFRVGQDGDLYFFWRTPHERREAKVALADIVKALIK